MRVKMTILSAIILMLTVSIGESTITLEVKEATIDRMELTKRNVYYWIRRYDIPNHSIVFRQALLETGGFTSNICLENNNLFGMRLPKVRPTTAIGQSRKHATYDHWLDSIEDYKLWQEYFKGDKRMYNLYYRFLKKVGYATYPYYNRRLKNL